MLLQVLETYVDDELHVKVFLPVPVLGENSQCLMTSNVKVEADAEQFRILNVVLVAWYVIEFQPGP